VTDAFKQKMRALQDAAHALSQEWGRMEVRPGHEPISSELYDEAFGGVSFDGWCSALDAFAEHIQAIPSEVVE
jgi:hypothetical protein